MRRLAMLAFSLPMSLAVLSVANLQAQETKQVEPPKAVEKTTEVKTTTTTEKAVDKPAEPAKAPEAPKPAAPEAPKPTAPAVPVVTTIPPDVQEKIEKARKAVAEAVAAAENAGLVQTSVEPPPLLDILVTGRTDDMTPLKGVTKDAPIAGIGVEAFGAWFTGYGKMPGIAPEKNVRIVDPSKGLKAFYDQRAVVMKPYLDEARKAYVKVEPPKEAPKEMPKEAPKPAETPKPTETPKPAETPKPEAPKPDAPKPEAPKPEAPKPEAPKPDAPKPDAPKPDAPKPDAPKPDAPKPEAPKPDAPKPDAPKPDAPKPEEAPKPADAPKPDAPKV